MNSKALIVSATSLVLSAVLLGWSPSATAAKRLEVLPMASIVRPFKLADEDFQWQTVVQSHLDGQPIHDAVFRQPTGPTEAIPVDCSETESIGVYFEVKTESKHKDQMRPFRFSWSHQGIDAEEPVRNKFRGAWTVPRVQGVLLYSDRLQLTEPRRVNGEWHLRVYHMGEEIYREEFNLMFCERPYTPRWYRDNTAQVTTVSTGAAGAVGTTAIAVSSLAAAPVVDDPLIREIDDTIEWIDLALNDYIREYLASVGLRDKEFDSIERKLMRTVRQERKENPAAYKQVPENIHLLQAKVQFLQSAHPAFQDDRFPDTVTAKFQELGELEERLRQEEAARK